MIIGSRVSKGFTGDTILENIDFKIGNNRKIGVVGKNGMGKSTLFELIAGKIEPDTGRIQFETEVLGYLPQEFNFSDQLVGEYLEKHLENPWDSYKFDVLANELKFIRFNLYQEIHTLSEGQKMKLKMMEVLLKDPTVLLIDEPTNHLDIEGIMWFENYIKHLKKTVVMISHDREFLNNTVDEIWEIENKKIRVFIGNYDFYKEEKLKLINKWDEEYKRFLRKKAHLDAMLARAYIVRNSRRGGVDAIKSRIKRELEQNKAEKYVNKKISAVNFGENKVAGKLMINFTNVSKKYGNKEIYTDLSFEIRSGQKVWLFGPNGAGKTTIVKMTMNEEKPTKGDVRIGENIKIGYFAQKQTHLDYKKDIFNYFMQETGCQFEMVFKELKKFLFEKDDLKKLIGNLSPGQRARFAFAIFAYNNYDLLILDEPTNHLDIETKEVIEESLRDYKGTLLLIEHDRFFVERVGMDRILNLKDQKLQEYLV